MTIITIITHKPKSVSPGVASFAEEKHNFATKAEAIAFIESLPDPDALPSGDGTSES